MKWSKTAQYSWGKMIKWNNKSSPHTVPKHSLLTYEWKPSSNRLCNLVDKSDRNRFYFKNITFHTQQKGILKEIVDRVFLSVTLFQMLLAVDVDTDLKLRLSIATEPLYWHIYVRAGGARDEDLCLKCRLSGPAGSSRPFPHRVTCALCPDVSEQHRPLLQLQIQDINWTESRATHMLYWLGVSKASLFLIQIYSSTASSSTNEFLQD